MAATQEDILRRERDALVELTRDGAGDRAAFTQQVLRAQYAATLAQRARLRKDQLEREFRDKGLPADDVQWLVFREPTTEQALDRFVARDPRVVESGRKVDRAAAGLGAFRAVAGAPAATMNLTADIAKADALREEHDHLRARVRAEIQDRLRGEMKGDRSGRQDALREQAALQKQQEMLLREEMELLEQLDRQTQEPDKAQPQLDAIRLEIKRAEELLGKIRQALQTLTMEREIPPRVVLLEPATIRAKR
jgi:hypothetical protein